MKRYFKYVKPYIKYFILGPICMIIEVIGEVLLPKLLSQIINVGIGTSSDYGRGAGYIVVMALLMIVTSVLMLLGGVGGSYYGAKASVYFASDLRRDIYKRIQTFSFANIDKFSTGSLITRTTNDITQLQNFINMLLRMCLRSPGMLIGAVIMAISINPKLSVVLLFSIPAVALVQFIVIKKGFPRFSKMQTKVDGLNSTVQENLTNVRVVKSFVMEDYETEKFSYANNDLKKSGINAMNIMILMQPCMMIIMNLTTLVVLWFGGRSVIEFVHTGTGMEVGDLTAFITYISQILFSLMMLTMVFISSSRALASAKRINEVMDEIPDINDSDAKYPEKIVSEGAVEFKDVSFRYYKNSPDEVLSNINLKIPAKSTVGIIGSTGSGKTTLVSLISRLYDSDSGIVTVDGVNVKDYSIKNLRDGVGMVLQKNVLFSGSIEDNLRWGNQDASMEEIKAVSSSAQADLFIESFPDKYKTDLGQGGSNVSGGQKQRLCIARALLKKPKILILDDSTSAVDTATEANIRKAFANELKDSTKIIIAQRITSVIEADMIVVMDDGKISGMGTHEELLSGNETYKEIYYSQMDKKEA